MGNIIRWILLVVLAALIFLAVCEAWWLRDQQTCSIQECNRGSCVQVGNVALRQCSGPPCREARRSKRVVDTYLYRILREDENPNEGLFPKDPTARKSIQSHVGCGSRTNYASQYISTTANYNAAKAWARGNNKRVAQIDTRRLPPQTRLIDLSDADDNVLPGIMARNFARKYAEVLIEGHVPPEAIRVFYTGTNPPTCGC